MTRHLRRPVARRVVALAVGALAVVAATGCSGNALSASSSPRHSDSPSGSSPGSPSASPSTTTQPTPLVPKPPPTTGSCRRLDYGAISRYSNADSAVNCTLPHTAYTFAVQRLPRRVDVAGVSIANKSIQDAALQGCREAYNHYVGGDPGARARSRLSVTYFLPAQADFDLGASWVRCDVVALETANRLADLPNDLAGILDRPRAADRLGVCSQGPPGAPASVLVMCTEDHTYRALTALRLGIDAARYPGEKVTGTQGQQRCSDYIAKVLGSTSGYTFGWTYPTASDWARGQRFGYCWNKATD